MVTVDEFLSFYEGDLTCSMNTVTTTDGVAGEPVVEQVDALLCCDEGFALNDSDLSIACEPTQFVSPSSGVWNNNG